jgi:peptide/nickel transport system permease protein
MLNYISRRTLQLVIVLFLLSFVCYALMSLMPGDPVDIMISSNPKITSQDVERLRKMYDLDKPMYSRYANWIKTSLSGDLGYSRTYRVPVSELLGPRLFNTFLLSGAALILSFAISLPLGIYAALKKGGKLDYFLNLFAFAGISVPSFWLAIIFIIIFSVQFKIFPAGGTFSVGVGELQGIDFVLDRIKYLILPTLSLSALQIGSFVRYTRSAMIEVMSQDYIRTARAKGLDFKKIVYLHALKNAMIPIITVFSISAASIFSGTIITETVFGYQGIGRLVYDSIIANDFNVAMISFIISIFMVLVMNLLADVAYAFVDPRIRYK